MCTQFHVVGGSRRMLCSCFGLKWSLQQTLWSNEFGAHRHNLVLATLVNNIVQTIGILGIGNLGSCYWEIWNTVVYCKLVRYLLYVAFLMCVPFLGIMWSGKCLYSKGGSMENNGRIYLIYLMNMHCRLSNFWFVVVQGSHKHILHFHNTLSKLVFLRFVLRRHVSLWEWRWHMIIIYEMRTY